jgi:hypothetical protein
VFDGSSFSGYEKFVEKWQEAYPAINVLQELRKAEAWLIANPKNSKSNYERFLNNWLSRAQDKAPSARGSTQSKNKSKHDAFLEKLNSIGEPNERDITAVATRLE